MKHRRGSAAVGGASSGEASPCITLETVPTAALIVDSSGRVQHANQRAAQLFERNSSTLSGMPLVELIGRDLLWKASGAPALTLPLLLSLPGGRRINVIASMSNVVESTENPRMMIVLTPTNGGGHGEAPGETVPRVATWFDVADRVATLPTEVLCIAIGITGMQGVIDSFSRSTGDAVLTEIGRRLLTISTAGAIVERIDRHHFVVVTSAPPDSDRFVTDIVRTVRAPIDTPLGKVAVGCAAGVATGPPRPPLILLDRADRNLAAALGRGAGTIERGEPPTPAPHSLRARIGAPLLAGVANRTISTRFQPVVDLSTGRVVEYEVLARWQDDCGEDYDVTQFIGAAEDVGVIGELGRQVLQSALDVSAQLYAAEGSLVPRVSVNVSPVELADAAFAGRVCSMLAAAAVPPSALQIELTDTISPPQIAYVRQTISRLREAGIRVALDGFGSHSANLRSLSDLDIDVVKVDGVMTLAALEGTRSMNLLRSVLDLSGLLGVEVIAKGVETAEQHQLLMLLGCRFGQGFLYSPPLQECEVQPHLALPATRASRVV